MLPELRIHSRAEVSPQVWSDIALAYEEILTLPKHSVVLAKNAKVVAKVTAATPSAAYHEAGEELQAFYRERRRWIRPWQDIVAVINFAPTLDIGSALGGVGVDAILALEHPPSHVMEGQWARPGIESDIVHAWIDPTELPSRRVRENLRRAFFFLA